jgi:signal transduction histidine kinase
MSVRLKIAITIFVTGALTALGVIATVLFAFQRFEHETTYHRGNAFLARVVSMYSDILELHERHPDEFTEFLKNLVLFEPDAQLYLLDAQGLVLASSAALPLPAGFKVSLDPVRQATGPRPMPFVMGDDPARMDADAVIAAKPLRRTVIRADAPVAGYLYLVAHPASLPEGRLQVVGSSFAKPALSAIVAVVLLATLLTAWIIAAVTRPLQRLSRAVDAVTRDGVGGVDGNGPDAAALELPAGSPNDEFGRLASGFRAMLATLRMQWDALRRLDHFRREGVSNLSHDLRSPLTATAACLETLESRWAGDAARDADRELVGVALRNTRNAARLVQSLGDLAQLDEPAFKLRTERVDAAELLDDIALRFQPRAAHQQVTLQAEHSPTGEPAVAALDIELFERAVANLIDNALKFCRAGDRIILSATARSERVEVRVADNGPGIAVSDVAHLFDRFYQSPQNVAPATGEGGKGLGLAIVKRIAELHGGDVRVDSEPGSGTQVTLSLPRSM